ncbi:DUF883 family protein [Phyllobacterium leguminum]|uniref:DUF883 domain-containing protein n=1 Tax=Phyllobacterium leguminum TaxID=314237 RepID=A0A318T3S2_9HYPH|nr:DNA gyrase subunit B [Phyllobacterium leguminum]PYE88731.1 hypothetical protein C7477_106103 [Phyllobacterium leguminum]
MARVSTTLRQAEDVLRNGSNGDAADDLQYQVTRLKEDIAGLAAAIADLGTEKVRDARRSAAKTYNSARRTGEDTVSELHDQLAQSARERPLATIAAAAGVGFLLALMARRH